MYSGSTPAEDCFASVLASARTGDGAVGVNAKAFSDLDWGRVTRALAERCGGRDAEELALALGVLPSAEVARRRRAEGDEMVGLLARGDHPPVRGAGYLGDALVRAAKGQILPPDDLVEIARSAEATARVTDYFRGAEGLAPLICEHAVRFADVREVAREVGSAFDPAGRLADDASKDLGPLRRRVRRLRDAIRERLDRMVKSPKYEGILQDDYVTIRDERYVLPVRAGERGDFPGIVHGQSGSGQTLFIEPEELISHNNELRIAQLDIENEERRILERLSGIVRRRADDLDNNRDVLTYLDLTVASARLAIDLGATEPVRCDDGARIELRAARHAVLVLRELGGELHVVPNDIGVDPGHVLVVSGPNTGGKTVTLKTVGLCALMARAGLGIPCEEGSAIPIFDAIHTDIGDEQTLERDLSTFSGHVANIAEFLPRCGTGALVLLDELFAGTDPEQGAALGRALLDELTRRGATVIVTTHLEGLKTLGFEDERFSAASMGFDVERLRPTYRLRAGVPGSSYALRIAARLGLDEEVIGRAESILEAAGSADHEALIQRLEAEVEAVTGARAEVELLRKEVEERSAALQRKREKLVQRDKRMVDREASRTKAELERVRGEIRRIGKILRGASPPESAEAAAELQRRVEEARAAARKAGAVVAAAQRSEDDEAEGAHDPIGPDAVRVGTDVWVRSFGRSGEVVEVHPDAGRVVVQLGALRANVEYDDLFLPSGSEEARGRTRKVTVDVERRVDNTLDLRGERVEEALERLSATVDRAARGRGSTLYVVHGHGTGALKRAVRAFLGDTPYPLTFRPGERGEGGDGVTVVTFAAD